MASAMAQAPNVRKHSRRVAHGVSQQFSMMIQAAVLLAVGIFVTSAVFSAIPSDSGLGNASTAVQNLTGQAFEIAPIVLIVIVAVMILNFVRNL